LNQLIERLAARLQHFLPQRGLSALIYRLMRLRTRWLKNTLIRGVGTTVGVDFSEARSPDPDDYSCFNAFFTRELKPGARPLDPNPRALFCPSDGRVSEAGRLQGGRLLQAKGVHYDLEALLAGDPACAELADGDFYTIYLSPKDYHRVHMPLDGRLLRMIHVPGRLFSVAPYTVRQIPGLFARNERVVSLFETAWGTAAQVLVGAMLGRSAPEVTDYADQRIELPRGAEMGRFNMGSTVVLVLPAGALEPDSFPRPGIAVRMGERLGTLAERGA
jgi:phosphatidylserine decarboxylase